MPVRVYVYLHFLKGVKKMAKNLDKVNICLYLDKSVVDRFDNVKRGFPWSMSRSDILVLLLEFYENHCLQASTTKSRHHE